MRLSRIAALALAATTVLAAAAGPRAAAATLCVNKAGTGGCYTTIGAAVAAAHPHDTVKVAAGTYAEQVVIGQPLSLLGDIDRNVVIDATGRPNGVYVDGIDNPGLGHVVVSGLTIKRANFEGILVTNATSVTLFNNRVHHNDQAFDTANPSCPGLPAFETNEADDCGEGIHLSGVDHSSVSNNFVGNNAGGILLTDDTGATHDNLVVGNYVHDNASDCGITLASHAPAELTGAASPLGVFHNTIQYNTSTRNGVGSPGGAGVGMFVSIPGAQTFGNVVAYNDITHNGQTGIAMHSHTSGQVLRDTQIIGNHIAHNGADTGDAATAGTTGINIFGVSDVSGIVITQNVIQHEIIDIAINTAADVDVHLNNLYSRGTGVANLGTGTVDASENYWGCAAGPGASGCSAAGMNVLSAPWLKAPF